MRLYWILDPQSGYSSLRYLANMPVDTVKFDISLIQRIMDERLAKLVEEMAGMLTGLGYELVAEGIETEELLQKVTAVGFNCSQGYLFGIPARHKHNSMYTGNIPFFHFLQLLQSPHSSTSQKLNRTI